MHARAMKVGVAMHAQRAICDTRCDHLYARVHYLKSKVRFGDTPVVATATATKVSLLACRIRSSLLTSPKQTLAMPRLDIHTRSRVIRLKEEGHTYKAIQQCLEEGGVIEVCIF